MKATGYSSIFNEPEPDDSLTVFTSAVRTDATAEPRVFGLSFIPKSTFTAQTPEWCKEVDFDALLSSVKRKTIVLRNYTKQFWMQKGDNSPLNKLRKKYKTASFNIKKDPFEIEITAQEAVLGGIISTMSDLEKEADPVREVEISLDDVPKEVLDQFFGGSKFKKFRREFGTYWRDTIQQLSGGNPKISLAFNNTQPPTVTITCKDTAKNHLTTIVANLQKQLSKEQINNSVAEKDTEKISQRLTLLCDNTRPLPQELKPGDKLIIIVARFVLHDLKVKIYGGFVRDWLIADADPTDIDCLLTGSYSQIEPKMQAFARQQQLQFIKTKQMNTQAGLVFCVSFSRGADKIDLDLREPGGVPPPTTCDSDVNNIQLSCGNNGTPRLEQKVHVSGYTIDDTLRNIRKKQFSLFMDFGADPNYAVKRAKKLLSPQKNFSCVHGIPAIYKSRFTPDEQTRILC